MTTANLTLPQQKSKLQIAHNALQKATAKKPCYYVESAYISSPGIVTVEYFDENDGGDEFQIGTIKLSNLENFAAANYTDDFVSVPVFVEWNLNDVVKGYLNSGREITNA